MRVLSGCIPGVTIGVLLPGAIGLHYLFVSRPLRHGPIPLAFKLLA